MYNKTLQLFIGMLAIILFPVSQASQPGAPKSTKEISVLFLGDDVNNTSSMVNAIKDYINPKNNVHQNTTIAKQSSDNSDEPTLHTVKGEVTLLEEEVPIDLTLNILETPTFIKEEHQRIIHNRLKESERKIDVICLFTNNDNAKTSCNSFLQSLFDKNVQSRLLTLPPLTDSTQPGMTDDTLSTATSDTIHKIIQKKDSLTSSEQLQVTKPSINKVNPFDGLNDEEEKKPRKEVNILCLGYDDQDVNDNISGIVEMIGRYIRDGKSLGGWKPRKTTRGAKMRKYNTMKGEGDYNGLAIKLFTTPPLEQPNAKDKQKIKYLHSYLHKEEIKIDMILPIIGKNVDFDSEKTKLKNLSNKLFGEDVTSYYRPLSTDEIDYSHFTSEDDGIKNNALKNLNNLVEAINEESFNLDKKRLMVKNLYPEDDDSEDDDDEDDDEVGDEEVGDEEDGAGSGSYIKWIGGGVLVIGGVGLLYYAFKSKKTIKQLVKTVRRLSHL